MPELTPFGSRQHNVPAMPETREKLKKGQLPESLPSGFRSIQMRAVRASDAEDAPKTYPIAMASDTPVRRSGWYGWYYEQLDFSTLRTQRMTNGLPMLVNHDPNQRAGIIPDAKVVDGVMRGNGRFGTTDFARGIQQEVDDGTLSGASIGYIVDAYERTEDFDSKDDEDEEYLGTFRTAGWEVYELSLTPIEADVASGVGRSADIKTHPVRLIGAENPPATGTERTQTMPEPIAVGEDQMKVERARTAGIADLQRRYPEQLKQEDIARFIAEGTSLADVKGYVLDKSVEQRSKIAAGETPLLNENESQKYSFMRAIRSQIPGEPIEAGFEREVSQTMAKRLGRAAEGIMIPTTEKIFTLTSEEQERRSIQMQRAGLVASTFASGGATVATELTGFIDLLRPALRLRELGATFMPGMTSNFSMPKMLSDVGFNWGGENPGVDNVDVDPSFGQVSFSPKQAIASTSWSRRLVIQSSIDIEAQIRTALIKQAAIGIEAAALNGPSGSTTTPMGLLNTAGVNLLAVGANGGVPNYQVWTALMNDIAVQNAELGVMSFLSTPEIRDTAMNQAELSNTISKAIWTIGPDGKGRVAGQNAEVTNLLPKNLTKGTGTGLHPIIYGYWPALVIAEFGAMDVIVNPYTRMRQAMIDIAATFLVDCNVTYPVAFSVVKDAQTNTLAM